MKFSELMQGVVLAQGRAEVSVGDDWMQGRSVFGGLQAAIGLAAMRSHVPANLPLRTLQMSFLAPVPAGRLQAEARVLRVGKSATQAEAHLLDAGQRLASLIAVFGEARVSEIEYRPLQPDARNPAAASLPQVAGITPAFTRHFSARWLRGGMPFSGSDLRQTVVEVDMLDSGMASEAHLLAIADFVPPVALSLLHRPAMGSSLSWMLESFVPRCDALPLSGWRIDSEMVAAQHGYTSQSNRIWAPDGSLAALSRQSMVVFG